MDVNHDNKLRYNETGFSKDLFNTIDKNSDSFITIDEVEKIKTHLEGELNALRTSLSADDMTLSSAVDSSHPIATVVVMTTTSWPVTSLSHPVEITSSVMASSSAVISSSPTIILSSLGSISSSPVEVKPSPSSDLNGAMQELAEVVDELGL